MRCRIRSLAGGGAIETGEVAVGEQGEGQHDGGAGSPTTQNPKKARPARPTRSPPTSSERIHATAGAVARRGYRSGRPRLRHNRRPQAPFELHGPLIHRNLADPNTASNRRQRRSMHFHVVVLLKQSGRPTSAMMTPSPNSSSRSMRRVGRHGVAVGVGVAVICQEDAAERHRCQAPRARPAPFSTSRRSDVLDQHVPFLPRHLEGG